MSQLPLSCRIEPLHSYYDFRATVDVLRLDLLHPVVSGNKWFKLKEYIAEATRQDKVVLTFGGAYSNHIIASAAEAKSSGLKSIGIIRGEKSPTLSHTLRQAEEYGMDLFFTSRDAYRKKEIPVAVYANHSPNDIYIIPEGGYGPLGALGAADILNQHNTAGYTHFIVATGTGTTLAGLVLACADGQKVIGVSALKNNFSVRQEISALLPHGRKDSFELVYDFHFGGYAKHTEKLIDFMNQFYERTGIPTDFVYTGKAFYAAFGMLSCGRFSASDRILLVHTGGLQGNRSLPKGTLIFG